MSQCENIIVIIIIIPSSIPSVADVEWALGAKCFVSLAAANFFDQCRFFSVLR